MGLKIGIVLTSLNSTATVNATVTANTTTTFIILRDQIDQSIKIPTRYLGIVKLFPQKVICLLLRIRQAKTTCLTRHKYILASAATGKRRQFNLDCSTETIERCLGWAGLVSAQAG
jgi:hypothetical protein